MTNEEAAIEAAKAPAVRVTSARSDYDLTPADAHACATGFLAAYQQLQDSEAECGRLQKEATKERDRADRAEAMLAALLEGLDGLHRYQVLGTDVGVLNALPAYMPVPKRTVIRADALEGLLDSTLKAPGASHG